MRGGGKEKTAAGASVILTYWNNVHNFFLFAFFLHLTALLAHSFPSSSFTSMALPATHHHLSSCKNLPVLCQDHTSLMTSVRFNTERLYEAKCFPGTGIFAACGGTFSHADLDSHVAASVTA